MASVDGSRTYLAGSDEVSTHLCGPCNEEGEENNAKFYCEVCSVYLCKPCMDEHKEFKVTKNHSVILATSSPIQTPVSTKESFKVLCHCNQRRPVEIYCEDHTEVFCPTCQVIKHRSCKTCPMKDKALKGTKQNFLGVLEKSKTLQAKIDSYMQNVEADSKKLDETERAVKNAITSFREQVNEILDKLENESLATLEYKSKEQSEAIQRHLSALSETMQALTIDKSILEKANVFANDETCFAAAVKISKNIADYEVVVNDVIAKDKQKPQLEFQANTNLTDILKSMESLGRIEASELRSFQDNSEVIIDMKVKSYKKVNIKIVDRYHSDENEPYITGCSFLSDGSVILCDNNNCKVKLLDSNWSMKNSLKVPGNPYSVAAIDGTNAVITYSSSNRDLQYVYTYPDFKLGKRITLPEKCIGLQVINDEIYTTYQKKSGHDEIWKLDRSFNIKSKIVLTQTSSGAPCYFGICNVNAPEALVYLTHWHHSKVTCFQLDGRMVFQYQDQSLKRPHEIYVDKERNSIVCGADSNNVVVITADGKKHREILTSKDITKPRCIDFRPSDNTLIIGCENSNFFVCKLSK